MCKKTRRTSWSDCPVPDPWPPQQETGWTSLLNDGGNTQNRLLRTTRNDRYDYVTPLWDTLLVLIFILGFVGATQLLTRNIYGFSDLTSGSVLGLVITLTGIATGVFFLIRQYQPIFFDFEQKFYQKGWRPGLSSGEQYLPFSHMSALQLLEIEGFDIDDGPYVIYEFNIILKDVSRVHIMSYKRKFRALQDCRKLASALDIPLISSFSTED